MPGPVVEGQVGVPLRLGHGARRFAPGQRDRGGDRSEVRHLLQLGALVVGEVLRDETRERETEQYDRQQRHQCRQTDYPSAHAAILPGHIIE